MDPAELCRTCLNTKYDLVPLFKNEKPHSIESGSTSIVDMLRNINGSEISANDDLPLQICTNCIDELQRSHSFKMKCKKSEVTLLKLKEAKLLVRSTNITIATETAENNTSQCFVAGEVIELDDDDDDGEEEDDNNDEEFTVTELGESGVDLDEEMIQNMTNDESDEYANQSIDETISDRSISKACDEDPNAGFSITRKKQPKTTFLKFDNRTLKQYEIGRNEKYMICAGCPETFTKIDPLRKHLMEAHTKGEMCFICDKGLQVTDIWKHCIDHLPKKYLCPGCGKRFIKRTYLKAHIKLTHSGLTREIFECKLCSKSFKTRSGISYHRQVAHAVEKRFACEICHSRFAHVKLLRLHMLSYHTDGPPRCKFCGQSFNAYSTMLKHVRRLHKGMSKQKVLDESEKSFSCAICLKDFPEKHTLETHVITSHTNFRQFKCTHCPYSFKYASVMAVHISTHHPNASHVGEVPNKCEVCSKSFRSLKALGTHINNVHLNIRPYLCIFCSYSFKIESNLETHIDEIHSKRVGQIEYKCDVCESLFYSRRNLLEHKNIAHNPETMPSTNSDGSYDATDYIFRTMFA